MYSPFTDKKGNQLSLDMIRFSHLTQLKEVDEGYKVEYKATLDDNVKKKIPSIITSFANSEGGWLIIGIDNNTHDAVCVPKLRADYDQTISQILRAHVNPIPAYSSKYIKNPSNNKEGVLVVYIFEGKFPPYIADGTVYVRNGSSKEPVKSERATIDRLYQKTNSLQASIDAFCKRQIHFPANQFSFGEGRITYPICSIYFKNVSSNASIFHGKFEQIYDYLQTSDLKGIFANKQYTFNSIILRHRPLDPSFENAATFVLEIFRDASAKIHIPIASSNGEQDKAKSVFIANKMIHGAGLQVFSGLDMFNCVYSSLVSLEAIYTKFEIDKADLVVCFELENAGNSVLFFEGKTYLDDAKENGIRVCSREYSKSNLIYLKEYPNLTYLQIMESLAYDYFLAEFGFPPEVSPHIIQEATKLKYPQIVCEAKNSQ